MERLERWRAVVVSTVIVVAVALPGLRWVVETEPSDGFPISTYPMFTRDPGRIVEVPTVVARRADGTVERLSPQAIAGTDQVIQASVTVRAAVAAGHGATQALCDEVAARIGGADLAVLVERHDAIAWAEDNASEPIDRRTVLRCEAGG